MKDEGRKTKSVECERQKRKGERNKNDKVGPNKRKRARAGTRRRAKRDDVVCVCDVTRNCREQREARGCGRVRHVEMNPGPKWIAHIRDTRTGSIEEIGLGMVRFGRQTAIGNG